MVKAHKAWAVERCGEHPAVVIGPTSDVGVGEIVASDVSDGRSIAERRSSVACDADTSVLSRVRSSQATCELALISKRRNVVEKPFGLVVDPADNDARLVPNEIPVMSCRFSFCKVPSCGVNDADLRP